MDGVEAPVSEICVVTDNDECDMSAIDVWINLDLVRAIVTNGRLVAH